MARVQVLELPREHRGDETATPFVLIIDHATEAEAERLYASPSLERFTQQCGARGYLITPDTLDIA